MLFGWEPILKEMAHLRSLDFVENLITAANLNRVSPLLLFLFHLDHLTSVDLYDGARYLSTPPIPKVGHAQLVAKHAHSFRIPINWLSLHNLELLVNLRFKRGERLGLSLDSV